jgi:hypothetical protein
VDRPSFRLARQTAVRWTARVLSAVLLLFWGFMIVGHLVGDAGRPSRPLTANDYLLMSLMGLWIAGLAASWKWELAGGAVTLVALAIAAFLNPQILAFPGAFIAVAGVLFLASWWIGRTEIPSGQPPGGPSRFQNA